MSCCSTSNSRIALLRAAAQLAVYDCVFVPALDESLLRCQARVRAYLARCPGTRCARFRVRQATGGVVVTKIAESRFAARGEVQRLLAFPLSAREKRILFRWRWNQCHPNWLPRSA